jgi:mono/diheme cytochrome c family protein
MTKLIVFITTVVSFALFIACANTSTNTTTTANTTNTASNAGQSTTAASTTPGQTDPLSTGHDLYVKNCANCHKETGEGGPTVVDGRKMKPDNLTDDRRKKLSDDKYIKTMVEGIEDEGMPSFKDKMSEAEMREVVKYIRVSLQKQDTGNVAANVASVKQ